MKGMREIIAGIVLVMLLASCATAYQKSGLTGGYGETRIDDSHYVVYFNGNGYTNKDRVWYFWVYRCAQLTMEKGFSYFSIEPIQGGMKKTASIPEQGERLYAAVLDGDADGRLINVSHGGGGYRTIYIPGSTIVTWHSKAIVAMYNVAIPQRTVVWRAQSVLDTLADYIKANGSSTPPLRSSIMEQSAYAVGPDKQVVNIHQYLLAHPSGSLVAADPDAIRQGIAPSPAVSSEAPAALPAVSSPVVPINAATSSMAQAVANQSGCGTVRADADARFVASCGAYGLLIGCDGGQCRPLHTVKNIPDE
ncbi:CC0125/CC1285 family lipoprotein [Rhodanobacter sp. BL-MT-08]